MILFSDIDGVLFPGLQFADFTFNRVSRFENILRDFPDYRIVISSGTRQRYSLDTLKNHFSTDIANRVVGTTPPSQLSTAFERQREIEHYLAQSKQTNASWIALDDNPRLFEPGLSNLVLCNPLKGLDESVEKHLRGKMAAYQLTQRVA